MSSAAHDAEHGHDGHGEDDGKVHAHVSPVLFLIAIFGALIFLTVVTVAVSYVDLGAANNAVAVGVATLKASLVAAFFMHLRYEKPFNTLVFLGAFVFLGLFMFFTLNDVNTRGRVDRANMVRVLERTGQLAPGGLVVPAVPEPAAGAPAHGGEGHH
ncbi:MAG: cytochrome C oxidase subunit IV family protein [Myxococcales bacterium]|nr:cytochrome C oxidase subunit IV family protein [Myxococcales bacterium]